MVAEGRQEAAEAKAQVARLKAALEVAEVAAQLNITDLHAAQARCDDAVRARSLLQRTMQQQALVTICHRRRNPNRP